MSHPMSLDAFLQEIEEALDDGDLRLAEERTSRMVTALNRIVVGSPAARDELRVRVAVLTERAHRLRESLRDEERNQQKSAQAARRYGSAAGVSRG